MAMLVKTGESGQKSSYSAKVMADILERSGIDRVLTVELHSEQIQGFLIFLLIMYMAPKS